MQLRVEDVSKLTGQYVYALKKDGTQVEGKLVRVSGSRLYVSAGKGRKGRAQVKAVLPLVLFDLLAIGTSPFAWGAGGFGPGFGGPGFGGPGFGAPGFGAPGFGPGFGPGPFFW